MSAATLPALRLDSVSIVFGGDPAAALPLMDQGLSRAEVQAATGQVLGVHDCSLDLGVGEILVLMGLSGSGKSTLLRAVNGLAPTARGRIEVNEQGALVDLTAADAVTLRRLRQRSVAMVFQNFALLPWRSVLENVALGLELAAVPRAERLERAREKLALVGLAEAADRRVGELSGGMQQRVGLARALATDAPILLMDEPFSALDPLIRARLQDELLELQARLKRSILFVSHDLEEAFKLGDRIAIMEGGRIVQCGSPRAIASAPADAYVADFVAQLNPLVALSAADLARPGLAHERPRGVVSDVDSAATALRLLATVGGPIMVFSTQGAILGVIDAETVVARLAASTGAPKA